MLLFVSDMQSTSSASVVPTANVSDTDPNQSLFVVIPYREIKDIKRDKNAANSEFSAFSNVGAIPNTVRHLTNSCA
jgi:hypothetical protein